MKVEKAVVKTGGQNLRIRSGPGTSFDIIGRIPAGGKGVFVKEENGWFQLENGGWMSGEFLKTTKDLETPKPTTPAKNPPPNPPTPNQKRDADKPPKSEGLDNFFNRAVRNSNTLKRVDNLDRSVRLFGAPFQHTKQVDFRVNEVNQLGRRYGETIMAEAPLVTLMPCVPDYLPDANMELKNDMNQWFNSFDSGGIGDGDSYGKLGIESLIKGDGEFRYYTTRPAYPAYCRVANLLCRSLAIFMGIGNVVGPDRKTKLAHYSWERYKWSNKRFKKENSKGSDSSIFKAGKFGEKLIEALSHEDMVVRFYVDANTSFSESFSNTTTASKMQGIVDEAEGWAKELSFMIGASNSAAAADVKDYVTRNTRNIASSIQHDGILKRLIGGGADILRGANIIFPELWSDSNPSRSFNINMTFSSPYGDILSIYYHCLVPLMHVIAFVAPIQVSANSYKAPFLVRAFSKGWFECEMGMIESVSIERAPDNDWTIDGFPSTIKVSMSITDLYNNLMVTSTHSPILFFKNHGLMNYLAVNGNINMNVPQPALMADLATKLLSKAVTSAPAEIGKDFLNSLRQNAREMMGM